MAKRISMVFLTMLLAIIAVLVAAKHRTGPNTVSFDDPKSLWLSIGIIAALFLPPIILSLFNYLAVRIISAIYQSIIALAFFGLVPIGLITPSGSFWISIIGILGTVASVGSIIVTI